MIYLFFEWQNSINSTSLRRHTPPLIHTSTTTTTSECHDCNRHRRFSQVFHGPCAPLSSPLSVCANRPISRSSTTLLPLLYYWCVRARERFFSLRSPTPTTRLNGKREQRCPLRFHMSSMFENRQTRCAHIRRTRQKIQFGAKDQRLFAHKGKAIVLLFFDI